MQVEKPYFMNNTEWYYFDEKEFKYKLTDNVDKSINIYPSK